MTRPPYGFGHQATCSITKNWPQWKKDLSMTHHMPAPDKPTPPPSRIFRDESETPASKAATKEWIDNMTKLQFGPLPGSINKTEGAEWISTDNYYLVATDGEIIAEVGYLAQSRLYCYGDKKYNSLDAAKAAVTRRLGT